MNSLADALEQIKRPSKTQTLVEKLIEDLKENGSATTGEVVERTGIPEAHASSQLGAAVKRDLIKREKRHFNTYRGKPGANRKIFVYWVGSRPDDLPGTPVITKQPTKVTAIKNPAEPAFIRIMRKHFENQTMKQLLTAGLTPGEITFIFTYLLEH